MIPNRKAAVSIGLLVIAGAVQAATFINTCPFVITSPGDYLLSADLICGGGDGITIKTGGVSLRLEGHRITAGVGANRAIVATTQFGLLQNISILGPGLITNDGGNTFSAGVFLVFVAFSEVSGITVLGSGTGMFTAECTSLTVTANTFGRNNVGLDLEDLNVSTISKNDVSGNGTGIFVDFESGPAGTVSHNVINGNTGVGVVISAIVGIATFQNNVVSGNGQYGILVERVPPPGQNVFGLEVTNNTSLANGKFDLFDGSAVCAGAVWSGNTFFNADQSCIH
jgi:hypothetical protein